MRPPQARTTATSQSQAFPNCARRFYNRYPCIVITAKGQPDVATRLFLRKLKATLNIPVVSASQLLQRPPRFERRQPCTRLPPLA